MYVCVCVRARMCAHVCVFFSPATDRSGCVRACGQGTDWWVCHMCICVCMLEFACVIDDHVIVCVPEMVNYGNVFPFRDGPMLTYTV